jgi:hypothetical protein
MRTVHAVKVVTATEAVRAPLEHQAAERIAVGTYQLDLSGGSVRSISCTVMITRQ